MQKLSLIIFIILLLFMHTNYSTEKNFLYIFIYEKFVSDTYEYISTEHSIRKNSKYKKAVTETRALQFLLAMYKVYQCERG